MKKLLSLLVSGVLAVGCARNELTDIVRNFDRNDSGNERMVLYHNGKFTEISKASVVQTIVEFDWKKIEKERGKPNRINVHCHYISKGDIDYKILNSEQIENVKSLDKDTLENRFFIWIPSAGDVRWHFTIQGEWWKENSAAKISSRIITMTNPRRILKYELTPETEARYKELWLAREKAWKEYRGADWRKANDKVEAFIGMISQRYFRAKADYLKDCLKLEDGKKPGKEPDIAEFAELVEKEGIYLKDLGFIKP